LQQSCSLLINNTRQFLQPFGVTPKQFTILTNLAANYPDSQSIQDVRDGLADKMSDASRLIDRLEKKGVIEKFPSDFDRRSNRVRISEEGVKLLTNINSQQEKLDLFIHDRLEEKEVNDLNELLSRLK
jgi:DNA-binding MarR family transcriptional regulator